MVNIGFHLTVTSIRLVFVSHYLFSLLSRSPFYYERNHTLFRLRFCYCHFLPFKKTHLPFWFRKRQGWRITRNYLEQWWIKNILPSIMSSKSMYSRKDPCGKKLWRCSLSSTCPSWRTSRTAPFSPLLKGFQKICYVCLCIAGAKSMVCCAVVCHYYMT